MTDIDNPLTKWKELLHAVEDIDGQPSAEQLRTLQAHKEQKKAFLETLTPDLKKEAKVLEKEIKKQQKRNEQKHKETKSSGRDNAKLTSKQMDKLAKQKKKNASDQARSMEKSLTKLCKWLGIKCSLASHDNEECFEAVLPSWLEEIDNYLDECDLAEGVLTLSADELEQACVIGVKYLAQMYFGEGFLMEFPFENLVERADTAEVLATKPGVPPWYKHMSYPMTEEEISLLV